MVIQYSSTNSAARGFVSSKGDHLLAWQFPRCLAKENRPHLTHRERQTERERERERERMDETDEHRVTTMASEPANETLNPDPELSNAPSKIREEGELSSSDNGDVIAVHQENPDSSFAQPSGTINPAAGSNSVPLVNKDAQGVQAGSNNIQLRSTTQSTSQKSFNKNQFPPKSVMWSTHTGTNKDLVISFSDDDSGSDFEENGRGKVVELKGNTFRLDGNQKPPISSLVKSNKLQHNARSMHKAMPKRFSLSRTFVSSITKINGPNSKVPGSLVGQGSQARNFNTPNRSLASRERGCEQGVVLNDNKLQDLRQQIALRESELKLKAAQQNKESASVLGRDNIAMKPKNDTARKYASVSTEIAQLEPKEPDRKRLKLGKSYASPQTFGSQQEVLTAKSKLPSKEITRQNCNHREKNKVDHIQKDVPLCRGESTIIRSQKRHDKLLHNSLQGADVNNGYNQTDKSDRLVDPSVAFNQSSLPENMTSSSLPKNLNSSELIHPPSSLLDKAASLTNLKIGMDYNEVISRDKMVEHSFNNAYQEPLKNAVLLNYNGNTNVSEHSSTDLQSFFEMEELIDKELEEAQEHRHKCEIGERNALKVYLKAQRALLEANARCTSLYHKRELYSSKLRSFILNNSSFSWSSGQHEHLDMGLGYLGNIPGHGYVIPTSSYQRQAEYNDINQPGFDSNNQGVNSGPSNTSYHQMTGANLGSEPCSEPDASTSEPLLQRGADGVYSPSDELDTSANENDEMSPAGHVSTHHDAEYHSKQESQAKLMDIDTASNTRFCAESAQDSLLLEARLRSELFARLGTRASKHSSACNNGGAATERGAENEVESEKSQIHQRAVPFPRAEENDLKGSERHERSISVDPAEIESEHNIGKTSLNSSCSAGSGDQGHQTRQGHHLMNAMNTSSLIFRSAFSHLKLLLLFKSKQVQSIDQHINANDDENAKGACLNSDETKWGNMSAVAMPVTVGNLFSEKSSYSFSPSIDPFWPLCMYELRGKCNDDECPWQHVKDYSDGNVYQHWQPDSSAGCQGGLTLHQKRCNGVAKVPKNEATILPTYLVGLDILRVDQLTRKSVLANRNTQYWQKFFSITLATSKLLRTGLQEDSPLLHGGDERVEIHGNWNKQFSSFQWRSGAVNPIEQALADNEQAIDMALLILNQEINKVEAVRKALSVLSRALETDPTSVVLWIVYLLIYYGNMKPIGKDDMFLCAVMHNEESYILWLMYINSRRQLDERLAAYDAALSALSQHASAAVGDGMHASACILDLFLQMMDCLCMSGNVEKAIQRSYGLFPATTKSNEPRHLSLSDILNCLTISDKCVFWVCCVYLVIYRKLPDAVVQRFECEKELLDIEWPFIHKSEEEKQMAIKLVEIAVESVDLFIYNESVKSEVNLRSAQLFALNHIRCMVALGSLEVLRNLLDKYVKLYPSCIELVLMSGRIQKQEIGVDSFMAFEEAINRWPKEVPGIQCIWNQYIENAFQNGRIDFAKEITVRWFHSVWQVEFPQNGAMDSTDGSNSCGSLELNLKSVPDTSSADHNQMDVVFKYLNLSIYKYLQNDEIEACIAIDKARKAAISGGLDHCLRKHTMFLLSDASGLKDDGPKSAIKKILEIYTDDSCQVFLVPKLLTRKFVDDIKKPRVQQLISNILSPVSFDCSLLNMILQSWYGSSLLPQTFSDSKYLVDFVEAILEVVPSNYQLAISVCKLLGKGFNSADLTSAGLCFWACSTLVNAILDAIPIPAEYVWVEAGGLLHNVVGIEVISERFYKRALTVYPFSVRLWKSFHNLSKTIGDASNVVEAAKERGIQLDAL